MNFKKIPTVLSADELTKLAFSRASKEAKRLPKKHIPRHKRPKKAEGMRVRAASDTVVAKLAILSKTLDLDTLSPFYRELIDVSIGFEKLEKAKGVISWAIKTVESYENTYRYKIRTAKKDEEIYRYRKEFYGKLASVLKKIDDQFEFLANARDRMKDFPSFEDTFTIVISGPPNVGKSTFLRAVTGATPKVDTYPFTTKQILVGYLERGHIRYQFVDTPGLLDRRIEDRNPIEKQAVMALKHLANVIVFIFDPTGTCGFPIEEQESIYKDIKSAFDVPIIPVINKADLLDGPLKKTGAYICSAKEGEGIEEIVEAILNCVKQNLQPLN